MSIIRRSCLMAPFAAILFCLLVATIVGATNSPEAAKPFELYDDTGATLIANIDDPEAVDAQSVCPGYTASDVITTDYGFTAILSLAGPACNVYGNDIDSLQLTVEYQSEDRLNVEITPTDLDESNVTWYVLPEDFVPKPKLENRKQDWQQQGNSGEEVLVNDLLLTWSNEPSFNFKVIRRETGDILFNTEGNVLVFEDQFVEFKSVLPDNYNLYGLGERIHGFRLGNSFTATTYATDDADPIDGNIYGTHPFYLETRYYEVDSKTGHYSLVTNNKIDNNKTYSSLSHGVFLRNAHGQEALLRPDSITWRTLGGSIDLYFYAGPTQAEVTKSYQTSTIGLPAMQQFFTLGYHHCRWGYESWDDLAKVIAAFEEAEIPLETIWSDIDYMDRYRDFVNDPVNYSYEDGKKFLDQLHSDGRHYVPIVDAAIYYPDPDNSSDIYPPFDRGQQAGSVWLQNPDGSTYIGAVWPGYTVFTDWQHPNASEWWTNELIEYYQKIEYDGIWIDMNELSSFCVGSCGSKGSNSSELADYATSNIEFDGVGSMPLTAAIASNQTTSSTESHLRTAPTPGLRNINHPPYVLNHIQPGHDLAVHAVSPNATHFDGHQEYDIHNLYGHLEVKETYDALLTTSIQPQKRPFIISRSTFAGSGKWAGHWGGDNFSEWIYMYFTIPQALSFSLFGIPMFGADACGFIGNSTEELCSRWMQLAAFFPFYRNHNVLEGTPQEPYVWPSVAEASRTAMSIRYTLLPYLYSLFYHAHVSGSTVMRALAWEFPGDPSLAAVDRQFLLGPSIMIIPVLEEGATSVKGVFPGVSQGEIWYDWYTQKPFDAEPGMNTTIDAPLGHIPVFLRGDSILALQQPALVTRDVRSSPWSLIVAMGKDGSAYGDLYLDDGESIDPDPQDILLVSMHASQTSETIFELSVYVRDGQGSMPTRSEGSTIVVDNNSLANVTILGLSAKLASSLTSSTGLMTLNEVPISSDKIRYEEESRILVVNGLEELTARQKGGAWGGGDWVLKWKI